MKIIIGKYEGTIYPEANGYTGAIHLGTNGKGDRIRLKGAMGHFGILPV